MVKAGGGARDEPDIVEDSRSIDDEHPFEVAFELDRDRDPREEGSESTVEAARRAASMNAEPVVARRVPFDFGSGGRDNDAASPVIDRLGEGSG